MAVLPRVLCRKESQHQLPDLGLPGLPGIQPRRAPSREDGRGAGGWGKTMATRVPAGRSSAMAVVTMRRETGALLADSSCQGRPLPPPGRQTDTLGDTILRTPATRALGEVTAEPLPQPSCLGAWPWPLGTELPAHTHRFCRRQRETVL